MKIRKFKAANSSIGMDKIRQVMGDDASILACYEVADGVEFVVTSDDLSATVNAKGQALDAAASRAMAIAAAVTPPEQVARRQDNLRHLGLANDKNKTLASPEASPKPTPRASVKAKSGESSAAILMRHSRGASSAADRPTAPEAAPVSAQTQADMMALKQELGSIRHWLENHLRQSSLPASNDLPAPILPWIDALGLSSHWVLSKPAILKAMASGVSPAQALVEALMQSAPIAALPDRGVVFVVGPAGAGKTTLVNKLVMSDNRRHDHGGVTLITTDGNRLGAQEQLRAAGRILDVPVHSAFTPEDLRDTLARLRDERLVIVDTAGLQAHHEASLRTLAMQLACAPTAEVILALPCDADLRSLQALMRRVAGLPVAAVALTRVDMSYAIAPVLALLSDYGLPVAALTKSPRMTDSAEASAASLELVIAAVMVQADEHISARHPLPARPHPGHELMA